METPIEIDTLPGLLQDIPKSFTNGTAANVEAEIPRIGAQEAIDHGSVLIDCGVAARRGLGQENEMGLRPFKSHRLFRRR